MENSPPQKLPSELRMTIYELILIEPARIRITGRRGDPQVWRMPGLLQTCRQLRTEASPTYFQSNTFEVFPLSYSKRDRYDELILITIWDMISEWLQGLENLHRPMLRSICMDGTGYVEDRFTSNVDNLARKLVHRTLGLEQVEVFSDVEN